jgi:hypothetical protein
LSEIPETRDSLLVRLKDPGDREAWDQFSVLYRPVIYRIARARGLQDADAQDLVQQVLMAVASAIPRWQRGGEHVRFRHWLRLRVPVDVFRNGKPIGRMEVISVAPKDSIARVLTTKSDNEVAVGDEVRASSPQDDGKPAQP